MFQIPSLFSFYSLIYRLFRPENQREIYIAYYKERNFSEKFTYSEYTEFVRCNDSLYRSKYLRKCSILRRTMEKLYKFYDICVSRTRNIEEKKLFVFYPAHNICTPFFFTSPVSLTNAKFGKRVFPRFLRVRFDQ